MEKWEKDFLNSFIDYCIKMKLTDDQVKTLLLFLYKEVDVKEVA